MKRIALTKGKFSLVDNKDFEYLNQWKWHAHSRRGVLYASRYIKEGTKWVALGMHNFINKPPKGYETDHRNGDCLDNRRKNLRSATRPQNIANSKPRVGGTSKYKGVDWFKQNNKWRSRIKFNYKEIHLGYFTSEKKAAKAYNKKAKELFGEFAKPNII